MSEEPFCQSIHKPYSQTLNLVYNTHMDKTKEA
jgi:hypothetical protein